MSALRIPPPGIDDLAFRSRLRMETERAWAEFLAGQRTTCLLATKDDRDAPIEAEVVVQAGNWAVHQTAFTTRVDVCWTVTHGPSGLAVPRHVDDLAVATRLAHAMAAADPGDGGDMYDKPPRWAQDALNEWYRTESGAAR